jgi:hypothetical protein
MFVTARTELQDGAHYMIYTPVDPLLFVAVKVCWLFLDILTLLNALMKEVAHDALTCLSAGQRRCATHR